MVNQDKRKMIQTLFEEGKTKKEIARIFSLDPKTVRRIISADRNRSKKSRRDKKIIDVDLLRRIYERCNGYVQRVHEILAEEFEVNLGYSTLTRVIRQEGIGQQVNNRCWRVPDEPGLEMQHDTTSYKLKIGGKIMRLICSGLYLRYSKMRYIKFYPSFNRFKMKCFFYEALTYWKYAANRCVIDNTSLAILRGTGKEAAFHPGMIAFARAYGFGWFAHQKGHANRKAGQERNFWTVEQNFFPGRTFKGIEDLNGQAFDWATNRYARRPQAKTRLIPIVLFEEEKPYLIKLASYIEPPYQEYQRDTDQYGYVAFDANYYWIPGKSRPKTKIIEYPKYIKIFPEGQQPIQYSLPPWGTRNEKFKPEGINPSPYEPKHIKKPCHQEEKKIRGLGKVYCDYLDFIKSKQSDVKQKAKFIRQLYELSKKIAPQLFMATIQRALKYHVDSIEALTRIAHQLIKENLDELPEFVVNNDYEHRETYQQGRFSQERELKFYQHLLEEKKEEHNHE